MENYFPHPSGKIIILKKKRKKGGKMIEDSFVRKNEKKSTAGPKAENDILMSNNDTETQWAPTLPHVGRSAVTENTRPVDVTVKKVPSPTP